MSNLTQLGNNVAMNGDLRSSGEPQDNLPGYCIVTEQQQKKANWYVFVHIGLLCIRWLSGADYICMLCVCVSLVVYAMCATVYVGHGVPCMYYVWLNKLSWARLLHVPNKDGGDEIGRIMGTRSVGSRNIYLLMHRDLTWNESKA